MYRYVTISLFFIYPIYSLLGVLALIYNNKKIGYFLLATFLAIFAYVYIPREGMDLDSHYLNFSQLYGMKLSHVYNRWGGGYFAIYTFAWAIVNAGLPKELVPLTVTFIGYCLLFSVLFDSLKNNPLKLNKNYLMLFSLMVIMNSHFWGLASGLRTALAFHLLVYGIYYYSFYGRYWCFLLVSSMAVIIHPAAFAPTMIFVFSKTVKNNNLYRTSLFLSLFFFSFGDLLYYEIASLLKPVLQSLDLYTMAYFEKDGKWAGAIDEHRSLKGYIYTAFFRGLPFYLMLGYLFKVRESYNQVLYNYLCLLVLFISIVSAAYTLYQRYVFLFTLVFCFNLLIDFLNKPATKFKKYFVLALFSSIVLYNVATFYSFYDVVFPVLTEMFLKPLFFFFL